MRPPERAGSTGKSYIGALACVATALAARAVFASLLAPVPYFTIYLGVLFAARYLGAGPAIVATVLGGVGTMILFPPAEWPRFALFMVIGALLTWTLETFRRARADADQSRALAEERLAQLEREASQRRTKERHSAQLQAIVESSEDAVISKDLDGIIQTWNAAAEQVFGYTAEEAIGRPIKILLAPDRLHEESDIVERIRRGGRVKHFETVRICKDGKQIDVSLTISPMRDSEGTIIGASHIARDITERKQFEEQVRQTQKLESLGVLAGGLAHDFNNLLTGIMGNASVALGELGEPDVARSRLDEILRASERAALLIRQMLAYAGKGRFHIERLDLSAQVREIVPLLRTSISKLVEIQMRLPPNLPAIEADRSQM
jgi:PAS domain S-box-containing protein